MSSPWALALLLAVGLVSLAASPSVTLERPTWTPGDYWTYDTNTTLTPGLNLTGSVTSTVQGQVPMAGLTQDAYRVLLSGSGLAVGTVTTSGGPVPVNGTWLLTGEEVFEPTTFLPLYNLLDLTVNGTYHNFVPFSIRVQNTTTLQVLKGDWKYPLAAGTNGTITVGYNFTQDFYGPGGSTLHENGTGEWTLGFSIAAAGTVHSPAGTFQAFPITETWPDGSTQRAYESPQAGNDARTESHSPSGNLTTVTTLTSYRYQALEPPTFLGLSAIQWAIVAPLGIGGAIVALLLIRRRGRRKRRQSPEASPPRDLTSGPRGP